VGRLSIRVDPQDGSYMPSRVKMLVGATVDSMKELRTVNVSLPTGEAADVVLLQDVREVC